MEGKKKSNKSITAIAAFVAVLAIYFAFDISLATYYNNLGTTRMANGEYNEAISCFTKAVKVRRKFPEAYCNRGTAHSEMGNHDKAAVDFDKAIELNPEFSDAYYHRAVSYFYLKQYDKSWEDVHKAQSLGHEISSNFLDALREISGRQA